MKAKIFFRASRGMLDDTHLYLAAFGIVTALIYQPPHPWGASDGSAGNYETLPAAAIPPDRSPVFTNRWSPLVGVL